MKKHSNLKLRGWTASWRRIALAPLVVAIAFITPSSLAEPPITPADLAELVTHLNTQAGECIAKYSITAESIADADLASAATAISDCMTTIDNAIQSIKNARTDGIISTSGAAGLILQYTLAKTRLSNPTLKNGTLDYINAMIDADGVNTDATGLKGRSKSELVTSLTTAMTRHETTLRNVNLRFNRATPRLMLAASGPSLHNPGSTVCWRVLGIPVADRKKDAANCPIVINAVNPAGFSTLKAIAGGPDTNAPFDVPLVAPGENPCSGRICFMLDGDMGGGNIEVYYPNGVIYEKVAERILFNRGDGRPDPITGVPTIGQLSGGSQFAGYYTGGYVGTFTVTKTSDLCGDAGDTLPQSGDSAGEVFANGTIRVDLPASGSGKVSGIGGYSTGGLAVEGGTAKFSGAIMTNRLNDVATARGTWTYTHPCGKASGTWLATR